MGGDDALRAAVALAETAGLGPIGIGRLMGAFATPCDILEARDEEWAGALGASEARAAMLRTHALRIFQSEARGLIEDQRAVGALGVVRGTAAYPSLLAAIPDPPPVLWVRGAIEATDGCALAVVGARRCTAYGLDQAARFTVAAAERGFTIVSGGARGIDAEAHRAALRVGGRTIAVLGSGLGCPYPPEHAGLFDSIAAGGGAVVSEFAARTTPRSEYFPRRNRIVSGLSLGVLVIEARERSGAAITARLAVDDHGREAMAIPGRIDSPASGGCLRAIREGWAALVASPDQLFETLREAGHLIRGARALAATPEMPLDPKTRGVARELVRRAPAFAEQLAEQEPIGTVFASLTLLEIQGLVLRRADGRYEPRDGLRRVLES